MIRTKALLFIAALLAGLPVIGGLPAPAGATHYRANQINWHTTATPGEVEFHLTGSWRMSAYSYESAPSAGDFHSTAQVGDVFSPTSLDFGDGSAFWDYWTVTAVDAANDVVSADAHVLHAYQGSGPWIASIDSCCRLSYPLHRNNGDGGVRVESLVNPAGTTASPVSLISPIVDCGLEAICSFSIPSTDSDGQGRRYRFATSAEAGGFSQPAGATLSSAGLYTWDTTGADLNSNGDSFFSTQVIIENLGTAGEIVATTPVDFFIRVTDSPNHAPGFDGGTPADATVIDVEGGQDVTFEVSASDPDAADTVSLAILGLPDDATFEPTPGNPATGTFFWSPMVSGSTILVLQAQDQNGLQALQRSITIQVSGGPPFFASPTPDDLSILTVPATGKLEFTVVGGDPDLHHTVTLGTLGLPPGATYHYIGAPGNPSTAKFTWTPSTAGDQTVTLTAHDPTGAFAPYRAITLRALKVATALSANAAVAKVVPRAPAVVNGQVVVYDVYFPYVAATLTHGSGAAAKPVVGRTVRFSAGDQAICQAVTRSDGVAVCQGAVASTQVAMVLANGYRAVFDGDGTFLSSATTAPLIKGP